VCVCVCVCVCIRVDACTRKVAKPTCAHACVQPFALSASFSVDESIKDLPFELASASRIYLTSKYIVMNIARYID